MNTQHPILQRAMSMSAMRNAIAVYMADPQQDSCRTIWHWAGHVPESASFSGLLRQLITELRLPQAERLQLARMADPRELVRLLRDRNEGISNGLLHPHPSSGYPPLLGVDVVSLDGQVVCFLRDLLGDVPPQMPETAPVPAPSSPRGRKSTLLLIDDDPLSSGQLMALLQDEYEVLHARAGAKSLDLLAARQQDISLVLLAVEALDTAPNFQRDLHRIMAPRKISMVLLTPGGLVRDTALARCPDATDVLVRPYSPLLVQRRVANLIRLRKTDDALNAVAYDPLTGLYTRQAFFHHAAQRLREHPECAYDLLLLDLESFHVYNERYGMKAGDKVLQTIGRSFGMAPREFVITGRLGGDEFVMLITHSDICTEDNIFASLQMVEGLEHPEAVVPKIGIYDNVDHSLPIDVMCDRARQALNTVKHRYGKLYGRFDAQLKRRMEHDAVVERTMRGGLDMNRFQVWYQPKHDAATGKLVGAEALMRWDHPECGFMSPGEFIPVFERTGFIVQADDHLYHRVISSVARWQALGLDPVPVSVNCSKLDFDQPGLRSRLVRYLRESDVSPELLRVEVTESLFATRTQELIDLLQGFRDQGIRVELDDFGTGYSAMTTLAALPLDTLKLDRSFMQQLETPKTQRVLATCVSLAHSLGLQTVAEGVQTEAQLKQLTAMGVDVIQGFYYAKPMPEDAYEAYLKKYRV